MAASTRGLANLTLVTRHFGDNSSLQPPPMPLHRTTARGVPNYSRSRAIRKAIYVHPRNDRGGVGRSSVGSDSTPPDMVADEEEEDPASGDEDHQYHLHQSKLFDSFWQEGPFENMPYPALLESPSAPRRIECNPDDDDDNDDDTEPNAAAAAAAAAAVQLDHSENAWPLQGKSINTARASPRYSLFPREPPTPLGRPDSSLSLARPSLAPRSASLNHCAPSHAPFLPPLASTSTLCLPFIPADSPIPFGARQNVISPPPVSPCTRNCRIWETMPTHSYEDASYSMPGSPLIGSQQHLRNYSLPTTPNTFPCTRGRSATCDPSYATSVSSHSQSETMYSGASTYSAITPTETSGAPSPMSSTSFATSRTQTILNAKPNINHIPARRIGRPKPVGAAAGYPRNMGKPVPRKMQIVSTSWMFPQVQDDFHTVSTTDITEAHPLYRTKTAQDQSAALYATLPLPSLPRPPAPNRNGSVVSLPQPTQEQDQPRSFFDDDDTEAAQGASGGSSPWRKSRLKKMVRGLQHKRSHSDATKQQQQQRRDETVEKQWRARAATAATPHAQMINNDNATEYASGNFDHHVMRPQRSDVFAFLLKGRRMH